MTELPKYNLSKKIGNIGLSILKIIVENELGWIFRINHLEDDFGIDAFIDIINELGQVTGKSIALQVKSGKSYFGNKVINGWIYQDEIKHLNYYLNHDIPIIIILVDIENKKGFWTLCDASKTTRVNNNWQIVVPFNQELNTSSKSELIKYVSPIKDYASQLENFWKFNQELAEKERILFRISKEEIIKRDFEPIIFGLKRLEVNINLISSLKEKVDIVFDDYDDDPREVYDIDEIRNWVEFFLKNVKGFSYFLAKDELSQFFKVIILTLCSHRIKQEFIVDNKIKQEYSIDYSERGEELLGIFFDDLNNFCEKHGIPIEINNEITKSIIDFIIGEKNN